MHPCGRSPVEPDNEESILVRAEAGESLEEPTSRQCDARRWLRRAGMISLLVSGLLALGFLSLGTEHVRGGEQRELSNDANGARGFRHAMQEWLAPAALGGVGGPCETRALGSGPCTIQARGDDSSDHVQSLPRASYNPFISQRTYTDCARIGENCGHSWCCNTTGMQCYKKNNLWATCRATCTKGPDPRDLNGDPWSCEELGKRTPGTPPEMGDYLGCNPSTCERGLTCAYSPEKCCDEDDWNCCGLGPVGRRNRLYCPSQSTRNVMCKSGFCVEHEANCSSEGGVLFNAKPCTEAIVPLNHYREVAGVGGWGGTCTCPDGHTYEVGDNGDKCGSLACEGGVAGPCSHQDSNWTGKHMKVTCHRLDGQCPNHANAHINCGWPTINQQECEAKGCCFDPTSPSNWCYPKDDGVHEAEDIMPAWVAKKCANTSDDCREAMCCSGPGMQCYEKDMFTARCRAACVPGIDFADPDDGKPWSCRKIGSRSPGVAPAPEPAPAVPPWLASFCSVEGEDCRRSRCCRASGLQCYEKDETSATCQPACPLETADKKTVEDSTCTPLGPRTGEAAWGSPSFFCFSILQAWGYEPDLMRAQLARKAGIFSCDEYAILSSTGNVTLGEDAFGVVRALAFKPAKVGTSKDGTAGNSELFMNAWDTVMYEGRIWNHDWVLKVDPDAVLIADRLASHLAPLTGQNVYIINCDKPMMQPMMFGSLEAFSIQAVRTYFWGRSKCHGMPWWRWGEDMFMGRCLTALGSVGKWDFTLIQDGVCKTVWCKDQHAAAFHPFKSKEAWIQCYNDATGKQMW